MAESWYDMFNKSDYDKKYAKEHITRKFLAFNKDDPNDILLLSWLNAQGNVNAYVKQLIRDDMALKKSDS